MARKAKEEVLKTEKIAKTTKKSAENKKSAAKSVGKKANTTKKANSSADKKSTTKTAAKKAVSKTTTKKTSTKVTSKKSSKKSPLKKSTDSKAKTTKKSTSRKTTSKKVTKNVALNLPEYYDLPYRYNQTIVKVLAQNPNTLFAYWDVSDKDRSNLEKQYGSDFFSKTKPVLVVHNLTDNYTFEIDINDFANNWYINVNDTKCKYSIELGRRPNHNDIIDKPINYLNIAFSNAIEIPNDHILFFKENDKIYFKNIKTNKIIEKVIKKSTNDLKSIYKTYNLSEFNDRFDFKNPSSQNPTSSLL